EATEKNNFLNSYQEEQFIEDQTNNDHIHHIYKHLYGDQNIERTRESFPLLVNAYRTQLDYVEQWKNYLITQPYNEAHQQQLESMVKHLTSLENLMTTQLFQRQEFERIDDRILFPTTKPFEIEGYSILTQKYSKNPLRFNNSAPINIDISFDDLPKEKQQTIYDATYTYHHNELKKWITSEDSKRWHTHLYWHILYCRLAFATSLLAGIVMGLGTTYLIVESFAAIPLLATIPLGLFPGIIIPLTLIAGGAYGGLIFNSSIEMILDNPFRKFYQRLRAHEGRPLSLKNKIMMGVTVFLFALTIFLTYCMIGTWITIFQHHAPLFAIFKTLTPYILNHVVPILIGLSVLPFSIQSIANTLENIEDNPGFDHMTERLSAGELFQDLWKALPKNTAELHTLFWKRLIPGFLGITAEQFEQETSGQKKNPYRIVLRLLFEPLKNVFFAGHIGSVAATGDQVEWIPPWISFLANGTFELAEDWDYFNPNHIHRRDTTSLLKNRFNGSEEHEHEDNIPVRILKFLFEPLFRSAAQWDYDHATPEDQAQLSMQQRYEILQGLNPKNPAPKIPAYRVEANHKLFLFRSSNSVSLPMVDACCANKMMLST
ncbi:MAG TPA: hypothetical protein VHD33_01205, partial [Legionellaceae bacterium]|nr:hypothetical protein [Legionellaceae bacterium]